MSSTDSSASRARTSKTSKSSGAKTRRYIFVVGGVMSGVGKGVTASSIAQTLQARNLNVTALKIDPYINVDAGTMNPTEHGEVFVLKDGLETDQDMGNYERFLNRDLPSINYMTTGSVYQSVIEKERNLAYDGKNVEVVPDIPKEVIRRIKAAGDEVDADVVLTEVGGTIGEYQNVLFLEAVRMLKSELPDQVATVMVSYLPVPGSVGEMKTKPTQTAVRMLNGTGVFADMIVARSPIGVDKKRKEKIARFCNVRPENVISAPDVESIYDIPLNFEADKLSLRLCEVLNLPVDTNANLAPWKRFVKRSKNGTDRVSIAVVGKYFQSGDFVLSDVYLSVLEAIKYSAYQHKLRPEIHYYSSQSFADNPSQLEALAGHDGILVPGGFGKTGIDGKFAVIKFARERGIPYFGICYGMQLAVVEYARNVLGLEDATSGELHPTAAHRVIDILPEQQEKLNTKQMGGTMRLGQYNTQLVPKTIVQHSYKQSAVLERHRHRFEVNPEYHELLQSGDLRFAAYSPDEKLVEAIELPPETHPFFVGVQFHPELQARPLAPHPLFNTFIQKSYAARETRGTGAT
jgi:CTP synthase